MPIGVGPRNALIVEHVRSLLSMFVLIVHNMIPKDKVLWTISGKFLLRMRSKLFVIVASSKKKNCIFA